MVSRPRASFDAGLLLPRSIVVIRRSLTVHTHLAASMFRAHAAGLHRFQLQPTTEARDCASSLEDGHVPCSLFSAHVVLAFTMLVLAFVFRRSRSRPRSGHCRRPLPRFRAKRPSAFSLRVHDQDVLAALTTSCLPMPAFRRSSGNTPSAHSPRARELVSRFDEGRRRSSSF